MTESGRILNGRYRLGSPLGSGAQGTVWLARDLSLDRAVAVKVTPAWNDGDSPDGAREHERRFHKEAVAMARIPKHPHVAEIHDHGADGGLLYTVMEYIEGTSLAAHLRPGRRPSLEQTVRWTKQICAGLAHVHAAGVVHRDVKPGNIVVDTEGRAHLVDFGLARLPGGSSSLDRVMGSLPYTSPEQLAGRATFSGDLYSLGCVMYEMLTGRTPFGHLRDPYAFLYHHTSEPPEPPRALRPGVPGPLDHLVMRLLEKDPADRPPDARAVERAVEQVEFVSDDAARPHVDSRHVDEIRRLERYIDHHAGGPRAMDPQVLDARSRHARLTGRSGDPRGAAALYQRLGQDCARGLAPGDKRAFEAFREAARWTERPH
ncbi:serine/threonine-protein kinase [Streptomyces sp. NPDC029216]|uniref:serine/threonine-protein kinase n=1 Tax=Streptomyces sp. NPDC029216 TaxID=3154701 RepID=UPI0033FBDF89